MLHCTFSYVFWIMIWSLHFNAILLVHSININIYAPTLWYWFIQIYYVYSKVQYILAFCSLWMFVEFVLESYKKMTQKKEQKNEFVQTGI